MAWLTAGGHGRGETEIVWRSGVGVGSGKDRQKAPRTNEAISLLPEEFLAWPLVPDGKSRKPYSRPYDQARCLEHTEYFVCAHTCTCMQTHSPYLSHVCLHMGLLGWKAKGKSAGVCTCACTQRQTPLTFLTITVDHCVSNTGMSTG